MPRVPLSLRRLSSSFSAVDVKIGARMLRKNPLLTLAAVFALAVGIPVGLAPSHVARALASPLPGDTHGRLWAIRYWDPLLSTTAPTLEADFSSWTGRVRSFSALGAFRSASLNVAAANGPSTPTAGAFLSPSIMPMLGVRPTLGRVLDTGDFAAGAPDVVVIGHGLWASRFGGDPGVIGRDIRIGRKSHVIVGVMPEGFAFPNNEALWIPLALAPAGSPGEKASVFLLGRLSDGVSPVEAQAELAHARVEIGTASASEARERARLQSEVVPFGLLYLRLPSGGLATSPGYLYVQLLTFALLLVACGNVAMLVFARTATRLRELAIRTALGASRARLVSQIFVETLLLALIGAGAGILVFDKVLDYVNVAGIAGATQLPYWLSLGITWTTALQAVLLAGVSATVAGVLPTVVITGRAIAQNIRGATHFRWGRLTGSLVVADIAISVAALGMAFAVARHAIDLNASDHATGIRASEYLAVEFHLPDGVHDARIQRDLVASLERTPGITSVAVSDALPRMEHRARQYEIEGTAARQDLPPRWTRVVRVDVGYFTALGVPLRSGRNFDRNDVGRSVIVNTAFVNRALGGGDPIGKRVRFPSRAGDAGGEWYQVIGVVGALGVNVVNPERGEAVYLPAAPGEISPMQLAIHATVPPTILAPRVREIAITVDPELVMSRVSALDDIRQGDWYLVMGLASGLMVLVGVLVALAASGLFAMLSLSVTERTREIGIRSALGASRPTLVMTILRRSLTQVVLGAVIGLPIAARMAFELSETNGAGSVTQSLGMGIGLAAGIVAVVGLVSCVVPARRILAVEASEAMR